jgi:hypothetical protein
MPLHTVVIKGDRMRKQQEIALSWVVYKMKIAGPQGPNAVCEQAEWDEMERVNPGYHTLIRQGIASEPEAERLAREAPGGSIIRPVSLTRRR